MWFSGFKKLFSMYSKKYCDKHSIEMKTQVFILYLYVRNGENHCKLIEVSASQTGIICTCILQGLEEIFSSNKGYTSCILEKYWSRPFHTQLHKHFTSLFWQWSSHTSSQALCNAQVSPAHVGVSIFLYSLIFCHGNGSETLTDREQP